MYRARVRIFYPLTNGRMVLRTELDWNQEVEASRVSDDRQIHEFELSHHRPYLELKPCVRDGSRLDWSQGTNKLLILTGEQPQDFYPQFYSGVQGRVTDIIEIWSGILQRNHSFRVYLPPGYLENQLKRYPVLYMHDGANLFFPHESFIGQEWRIDETLDLLNSMNLIDQTIVVGIHARDRFRDYTSPGYLEYGQSLIKEVKPWIDDHLRTLTGPQNTSLMGSSLGGVVSFYLGWERPEIFGAVACLSSTFSDRDDLIERVRNEPVDSRRNSKFYLDSGWPGDNYEVTLSMAAALIERGFKFGKQVVHYAFPWAGHNEAAWAGRVHLPIQLFSGKLSRLALHS